MSANWIAADWPAPDNVIAGTILSSADVDALSLPGEPCWLNQVHGARVVRVGRYATPPDADASIGRHAGDVCVVKTADCLPVLLCSADGEEIAAAHAGWRGLAAGVIEATITRMSSEPASLMSWLGPAISQAAFEVGDEVREAFVTFDPAASGCFRANRRGRWQADLYELARLRLAASGITAVYGGGFCTFAEKQRFHSYRRNPDCGRMVSFIARISE